MHHLFCIQSIIQHMWLEYSIRYPLDEYKTSTKHFNWLQILSCWHHNGQPENYSGIYTNSSFEKVIQLWWRSGEDAVPAIIRLRVQVPSLLCRHLGIGSPNHNWVPDMTRWLCMELVLNALNMAACAVCSPGSWGVCWYETGRSQDNNVKRPWTSH